MTSGSYFFHFRTMLSMQKKIFVMGSSMNLWKSLDDIVATKIFGDIFRVGRRYTTFIVLTKCLQEVPRLWMTAQSGAGLPLLHLVCNNGGATAAVH